MENLSAAEEESPSSSVDTDVSDSDAELDAHLHSKGEFFGCYLLVSRNPEFKGRTYIGFTVNPNRRIKQHNDGYQKGGAKKTNGRGPWDMVLIVHGFPNHIIALRFEWAWQHPNHSRRLGKTFTRKKRTESPFEYQFRILTMMLSIGPWWRLPLTIRWLKQEYQIQFPPDKQPPVHMPIAYGPVDICKSQKEHISQPITLSERREDLNEDNGCIQAGLFHSQECQFCDGQDKNEVKGSLLHCYHKHCTLSAHITCLAPQLTGVEDGLPHLIPVAGPCPKCGEDLLWGELIRIYKNRAKGDATELVPIAQKKRVLSSSQPVHSRSHVASGLSHWSEALHMQ